MSLKLEKKLVETVYKFWNEQEMESFVIKDSYWDSQLKSDRIYTLSFNANTLSFNYSVGAKDRVNYSCSNLRVDKCGGLLYTLSYLHNKIESTNNTFVFYLSKGKDMEKKKDK